MEPKWLPKFLRISVKPMSKFDWKDLQEIELFAHYVQITFLVVAVTWAVSWFIWWQLTDYRREMKRRSMFREANTRSR
jgi:hypothetical protein